MLTNEQIIQNKMTFLKLISEIDIPGADTQGLVGFLDTPDDKGMNFFNAPASTIYHNNYEGGLCEHSLNVYYTLVELYEKFKDRLPYQYDKNTLLICGLLHDISKNGFYEKYTRNEKHYHAGGSKHDNGGAFDWIAVDAYKTKDAHDRILFGTHEENSMYLLGRYIPLSEEEMVAILNHHAGVGQANQNYDLSAIANKYPLQPLLHMADYLSTFILERF